MTERGGVESDVLDAFVDGELSDGEQRELLSRLDGEPEGWRRLALAFVEAQRWRRELRAVVADAGMPSARPVAASALAIPVIRFGFVRRFAGPLVVTAASLAVGLLTGYGLRSTSGPVAGLRQAAVHDEAGPQKADETKREAVPIPDGLAPPVATLRLARLGFTDPASGELRHIEAAVTGPPEAPVLRLAEPVSSLPPHLRSTLERAAVDLVTSQRVYPLRLETGEPVMLVGQDEVDVRLRTSVRPVY